MKTPKLLTEIKHILKTASSILISGQGNPDGDSLGAQLALYDILSQQKQVMSPGGPLEMVICNDFPPPAQYGFLPNLQRIVPFEEIQDRYFEVGFVLDSGTDRVGKVLPLLEHCRHVINIDHHQSRKPGIETLAWIEPETCSVAEMLYAFFEHPDWKVDLTPSIAYCLYAGIIYDTGSFRYPNTAPRTHRIAAKCIETGIDFAEICEKMFLEKSMSAIRLLAAVLDTLQYSDSGNVIWGKFTQDSLRRAGATPEEDEGIITHYAFAQGTKVAALFKEISEREIKVSFRAHGDIDVGRFAQQISSFGGGHARAAGCTLKMTLEEAEKLVIAELEKEFEQGAGT